MELVNGQVSEISAEESGEIQIQKLAGDYDIIDGIILPKDFQAELDGGILNINGEIAMDTGLSELLLSSGARIWAVRGVLSNPQIAAQ